MGTFELPVDSGERAILRGGSGGRKGKLLKVAQSLPVETGERLRLFCMCILGVRSSRRVFAFILQSIQRNDGSIRSKASLPTSGLACKLPRLLLFFLEIF